MKQFFAVLALLLSLAQFSNGQSGIPETNWLKTDELTDLISRPLLVLEYTEAQIRSAQLQKKLGKSKDEKRDRLQEYDNNLKQSDENFKNHYLDIVKENWKFNDVGNVRMVSHEEAYQLLKDKSEKYAILMVRPFGTDFSFLSMQERKAIKGLTIPFMILQGSEKYGSRSSSIGFPFILSSDDRAYSKSDIAITTKVLNHFVEVALKDPKKLKTKEFLEQEILASCDLKQSLPLHMNEEFLKKNVEGSDVDAIWPGKVKTESPSDYLSAFTTNAQDAFAVFIPVTIAQGSALGGMISSNSTIYGRLAVQPSTGKILGYGKTRMGEKAAELFFKESHIEDMTECE